MAKQIDDIVSFDPAEFVRIHQRRGRRQLLPPADPARHRRCHQDRGRSRGEARTVSPDGLTFTFKLRRDAKFESGNPVTANDAAFSLQRVVKLNKTPGFIVTQFGFTPDNVEKTIRALDDYTLELKLPQAQATSFVLYCLSANVGSVVDMKTVMANQTNGDLGNAWLKTHTAGAGPYKLTEWQASDHVIIDVNPNAAEKALMRRVVLRHVADPSAQLLLLQKGDVDIARELGADQLKSIAGNKDLTLVSSPQGTSMYIAMNQATAELRRCRCTRRSSGRSTTTRSPRTSRRTPGASARRSCRRRCPARSRATRSGRTSRRRRRCWPRRDWPDGFAVTMDYISTSPNSEIAQAIQADLAAIGIKVQLQPGDQKQVITKTRARQHQLAMLVWGTDYFDPNSNSQAWCENPDDSDQSKLKILAWRSHFVDKELTGQSQAAVHELDPAKRIALYGTIQQQFMERAPFAMLLQKNAVAVLGKGVSGFKVGPMPDYTHYAQIAKA